MNMLHICQNLTSYMSQSDITLKNLISRVWILTANIFLWNTLTRLKLEDSKHKSMNKSQNKTCPLLLMPKMEGRSFEEGKGKVKWIWKKHIPKPKPTCLTARGLWWSTIWHWIIDPLLLVLPCHLYTKPPTHTQTNTQIYAHIHTHIHPHTEARTHMRTYRYTREHKYIQAHTHTHTHTHTHHTHMYAHMHQQTHAHEYNSTFWIDFAHQVKVNPALWTAPH